MTRTAKTRAPARDTSSEVKTADLFIAAGYSPEAAAAIVRIDATMQRIRRSISKREFVADVLREMDAGIDLQLLDVMGAVSHWHPETLEDAGREVTVGTVAERVHIDPSRASRLVSELVDKGYVRRVASQADSRRIVLEATEKGWAFGEEFRRRKGGHAGTRPQELDRGRTGDLRPPARPLQSLGQGGPAAGNACQGQCRLSAAAPAFTTLRVNHPRPPRAALWSRRKPQGPASIGSRMR
jgi:DNA-binding MarR family transcriptional regulator